MVRRKIEIKPIEVKSKLHTCFTKRRQGLIRKIEKFCKKSDSSAAAIVFSNAGNGFIFGHPDVDAVLERYEAESSSAARSGDWERQKSIGEAINTGRWDQAVRGLDWQKLDQLYAEVANIKTKLEARQTLLQLRSSAGDSTT